MKLRNKKTGEIVEANDFNIVSDYNTLAELNEEWEDYEEMGYWYIDFDGDVLSCVEPFDDETEQKRKEIGNYFDTREEAEKAVEKLKAWKRLKDKGFRFNGGDDACISYILDPVKWDDELEKDFGLLFGGEE